MFTPNYIQKECSEIVDITPEVKEIGEQMLAWAKERNAKYKDCIAVAAPQLGMDHRIAVLYNTKYQAWHVAANLNVDNFPEEDTPYEYPSPLFNFPKKYVLFKNMYSWVDASYYEIMSDKPIEEKISGTMAIIIQGMTQILDGTKLEVVPRDYRTVRKEEARIRPNASCSCGSGRKYKVCCGR